MTAVKIHGALNDKNDPDHVRRNKHAKLYYDEIRNSKKAPWVEKVAANSKMDKTVIGEIYDHIFMTKHNFDGELKNFDPSYDMAESFRRLHAGKNIKPHDIVLLEHERLEIEFMKRYGLTQNDAHILASREFNYADALKEVEFNTCKYQPNG